VILCRKLSCLRAAGLLASVTFQSRLSIFYVAAEEPWSVPGSGRLKT